MSVGTVVKEVLARTDELGEAVFCFFIVQFCSVVFFFNPIFPFGWFPFILTADPLQLCLARFLQ